jgi:hypothetical protein
MKRLAAFEVAQKVKSLVFNSVSGGRKIDVGVGLLRDTDLTRISKPFVLIALVSTELVPESHQHIYRETDHIEAYVVARSVEDKNSLTEAIVNAVLNAPTPPYDLTTGQPVGLYVVSVDYLVEEAVPNLHVARVNLRAVTILP